MNHLMHTVFWIRRLGRNLAFPTVIRYFVLRLGRSLALPELSTRYSLWKAAHACHEFDSPSISGMIGICVADNVYAENMRLLTP